MLSLYAPYIQSVVILAKSKRLEAANAGGGRQQISLRGLADVYGSHQSTTRSDCQSEEPLSFFFFFQIAGWTTT